MRTRKRRPHGRITLQEVARDAGVSTASASRALNQPASVRPEIQARVGAAAVRLGYRPNAAARALAGNRSRMIGIIVPTIANSIFAPGVEAIERFLDTRDYGLVIASSDYDGGREAAQARRLAARGVDGLILVGAQHRADLYDLLASAALPAVFQGAYDPGSPLPCVGFDNHAAMRLMAEHVIGLGHRRLAILAGMRAENDRVEARIAGALEAAAKAGIAATDVAIAESRYDVAQARRAAAALIARAQRATAILCVNDILAIGAVLAARDAGLVVPRDLTVTGFDDFDIAAAFDPPITTIRVPVVDMGRGAAMKLLDALEGREGAHASELPVALVRRASCGTTP